MAGKNSLEHERFRIWHRLHASGLHAQAADRAYNRLLELTPPNFEKGDDQATNWTDLSRQTVVTALAAAKQEPRWETAQELLQRAANVVTHNYPVSADKETAQQRGTYWQNGMDLLTLPKSTFKETAAVICARDILNLSNTLYRAYGDERFAALSKHILDSIRFVSKHNGRERFALMTFIENEPFHEALKAFYHYSDRFAPSRQVTQESQRDTGALPSIELRSDVHEYDTVSRRIIGKSLRQRRFKEAWELLKLRSKAKKDYIEAYQLLISATDDDSEQQNLQVHLEQATAMPLVLPIKETLTPFVESTIAAGWRLQQGLHQEPRVASPATDLLNLEYIGVGDNLTLPMKKVLR